jgi:hypothetical protein
VSYIPFTATLASERDEARAALAEATRTEPTETEVQTVIDAHKRDYSFCVGPYTFEMFDDSWEVLLCHTQIADGEADGLEACTRAAVVAMLRHYLAPRKTVAELLAGELASRE